MLSPIEAEALLEMFLEHWKAQGKSEHWLAGYKAGWNQVGKPRRAGS